MPQAMTILSGHVWPRVKINCRFSLHKGGGGSDQTPEIYLPPQHKVSTAALGLLISIHEGESNEGGLSSQLPYMILS